MVDDASPDESSQKVEELDDPRIVILRHEVNQGVGGAVLTGFNHAVQMGATVLVKLDGDGQMAPADIEKVILPIVQCQADYVKANRFYHLREISRMPIVRRMGNLGALVSRQSCQRLLERL